MPELVGFVDGALFDMDGTLVDREPLMTAAVVSVMAETPLAVGHDEAAGWVGRAWTDVHDELGVEAQLGWDLPTWHGHILDAADRLVAEGFEIRALTGGEELIVRLATAGVPVAVVTGSTHAEVDHVLELLGVAGHVSAVVAAGDYRSGKPDPEPFLLGAERLGVDARRCVAFEDSRAGVRAALAAGAAVVATEEANAPVGHAAHQRLHEAHHVAARLADVSDELLVEVVRRCRTT